MGTVAVVSGVVMHQVVVGAAGQLINTLTSAGSDLVGVLATIEEKLEEGGEIKKVS